MSRIQLASPVIASRFSRPASSTRPRTARSTMLTPQNGTIQRTSVPRCPARRSGSELHHMRPPRHGVAWRSVRLRDHLEPDRRHLDQQHAPVPVGVERRPRVLPVAGLHLRVVDQARPADERDVRRHALGEIVKRHPGTGAQLLHLAAAGVGGQPHHPVLVRRERVHGAHGGIALFIQRCQRHEPRPLHHLARDRLTYFTHFTYSRTSLGAFPPPGVRAHYTLNSTRRTSPSCTT